MLGTNGVGVFGVFNDIGLTMPLILATTTIAIRINVMVCVQSSSVTHGAQPLAVPT